MFFLSLYKIIKSFDISFIQIQALIVMAMVTPSVFKRFGKPHASHSGRRQNDATPSFSQSVPAKKTASWMRYHSLQANGECHGLVLS